MSRQDVERMFRKINGVWNELSSALGVDVYEDEKYGSIECLMVGPYILCRFENGSSVCYEVDDKAVICSSGRVKNRLLIGEFVEYIEKEF